MNANAKYFWLNVVPTSGVEDGSIAISGVEHTGRAARLFSLNVQTISNDGQGGQEPAEPIVRNISGRQETAAMFLNLSQGSGAAVEGNPDDLTDSEIIVSKAAGTITVTGTSNAQKLTISAAPVASDLGAGARSLPLLRMLMVRLTLVVLLLSPMVRTSQVTTVCSVRISSR